METYIRSELAMNCVKITSRTIYIPCNKSHLLTLGEITTSEKAMARALSNKRTALDCRNAQATEENRNRVNSNEKAMRNRRTREEITAPVHRHVQNFWDVWL